MKNILPKELKIKFIETLSVLEGFSYEEGNPFLIKINTKQFFVFLKNLSPAYFKNSPDITRVQLPYSEHFSKTYNADIPFIILGYDVDNDSFVTWNPQKVKDRLNAKSNVSLYARESFQANIAVDEFKTGFLTNGDKIIVFRRESLSSFFDNAHTLFEDIYSSTPSPPETASNSEGTNENLKLEQIEDQDLLFELEPLLMKNRVLECVKICTAFYEGKYPHMTFKDWFTLVNNQYQKINKPWN